jgi:hypothetical protein
MGLRGNHSEERSSLSRSDGGVSMVRSNLFPHVGAQCLAPYNFSSSHCYTILSPVENVAIRVMGDSLAPCGRDESMS